MTTKIVGHLRTCGLCNVTYSYYYYQFYWLGTGRFSDGISLSRIAHPLLVTAMDP